MGASEWTARRAWVVIALWVVVALLSAPLASKLNDVVVTEERGMLPENVESIKAQEAIARVNGGASAEPSAIIVVDGVEVGPDLYFEIAGDWGKVRWGGANHTSWVDVAGAVYSKALEGYLQAVNGTVAALEGYRALWLATLNATSQLRELAGLVNATASLAARADEAYAGYYQALAGLASATPQLLNALQGAVLLCGDVSRLYASTLFDVVRAEFLLENATRAYEEGVLTDDDVARVVEASNLTELGIPPLSPDLVRAVFNYTTSIGGPGAFNNTHAARLAGLILEESPVLPAEAKSYVGLLAAAASERLAGIPDLRGLPAQGPQGVAELYRVVWSVVADARLDAIERYGAALAEERGSPLVALAYEELAARNCSSGAVAEALRAAYARYLESTGIPPLAAEALAAAAAQGNASREVAARAALATVAAGAAAQGAPGFLVEALNSTRAVEVLLELDPNASGAIAGDPRLALEAAARILEPLAGQWGVSPEVIRSLAAGGDPEELAVELVASRAPAEARPLLDYFKANGVPEGEDEFLEAARQVLASQLAGQLAQAGIPASAAGAVVDAALRVYRGESTPEAEASRLAAEALKAAWPSLEEELRGVLVSRDGRAFLVLLFNAGYEDAERVKADIRSLFESHGYTVDVKATGGVVTEKQMREAALEDVERSDRYSMILVLVILALILESVVAVLLPFTGIGLGLAAALGLAYVLAKDGAITVTSMSRTIMFSTGLGLGIDYATFIARRFREELAVRRDPRLAAAAALRASARPVLAGAATAAIGFGSLGLAWDFPFLRSIGESVPLAIALVVAASLTFIPALLALVGGSRILWWPRHPSNGGGSRAQRRPGALGALATRGAPVLVALVLVALVPAVYVHAGFKGSHDLTIMMPEGVESLEGLRLINERFDPGVVYPIYVVPSSPGKAGEVAEALKGLSCISRVEVYNASGGAYVVAVPSVNPLSSEGVECARQARRAAHSVDPGSLVGGMAAVNLDLEELLNERFYHRVLPAAVSLMFASMLLAYGGVAVALAAVAAVAIAAEYSIALTIYYFQSVEGSPVPWYLPITVFTAILGVGMDYNSFSISRAAEECLRECSREAVARAVSRAARLVLGLAAIMAGAYGGLVLSKTPGLRMTGASLALGVIFAGILAGVALTPALIALMGRGAWWPWGPKAEVEEAG